MDRVETNKNMACPSPDLAAYIDGELSSHDELELEMHLASCRTCADDLNLQKSFLNALDSSLDDKVEIQLPKNFTKLVVANAESRVSGLRHPHELRNAALICTGLILFSLFALGSTTERSLAAAATVVDKLVAVVTSAWHVIYDLALGSSIVLRSLASSFFFESGAGTALAFFALFVLSLYLFSRLVRFRRT
jgi:anti-sigma factor RsiW